MNNKTYYIDPDGGNDSGRGLAESDALASCEGLKLVPGDTVLFKRGSVIRGALEVCNGSQEGNIVYGAYGEGERPVFLGSESAGETEEWVEEKPSVWRYNGIFSSEVCNLVFNGTFCGNLRWSLDDIKNQGEWYYTQIGYNAEYENTSHCIDNTKGVLYLFSSINPGHFYNSIECSLWGKRRLVSGKSHVVIENLSFQNSGVHGYQEIRAAHIRILNCEFKFIGGAVWSRDRRIRFGNAVEFWDGACDIAVEGCVFANIYDSGVTHQGSESSDNPENLIFRDNLFMDCGMAAYEYRGPAARVVCFEYNTCINAGGGFSMQGEAPPRQSEIYPQPMGHHIFIWRIDKNTQKSAIFIRNNIFYEAPYGGAIFSIIDPIDEALFVLDYNCYYQTRGTLLAEFNRCKYKPSEFELYKKQTGKDIHSIFEDPMFCNEAIEDYQPRNPGLCFDAGIRYKLKSGSDTL